MSLADTLLLRGESERKARTANQLILMSSVAKNRSIDRLIRTEST